MLFCYNFKSNKYKNMEIFKMFLKISTSICKIFVILSLLCLIFFVLSLFNMIMIEFDKNFPNGKGIVFFTQITGLLIPHFVFFLASFFWIILVKKITKDFVKFSLISFIPIFIFWTFYFIIYVLDYSVPFFYFGQYQTLRSIDFF